jgi:TolA-binding protein
LSGRTAPRAGLILLSAWLAAGAEQVPVGAQTPEPKEERPIDARLYAQGLEAVRAGRRDEGIRALRSVFGDFPDSPYAPQAMFRVADLLYPVSAWEQIGSAAPSAIKEADGLLTALARKYRAAREAPRALVKQGYLGLEPANPEADPDQACGHFATAAQVYPESDAADDAYFGLGMCESLRAHHARAADVFGRLLDEHPTSPLAPQALYRLGVALSHLDDAPEAMLALQELRNRYPESRLAARALERITLIHRLRLLPQLAPAVPQAVASASTRGPASPDQAPYRLDEGYGPETVARAGQDSGLRGASDLAVDPQGLAVVASPRSQGVFRLDAKGRVRERIVHPEPEFVAAPDGLAVYISGRGQIAVNTRHWGGPELKDAQGRTPSDFGPIAVDSAGRIYLLDRRANAVSVFDRDRRLTATVRPAGKEGRFVDIAMGEDGGVFVLDGRARMVTELHEGKATSTISLSPLDLQEASALAVDSLGDLFILDGRANAIIVTGPAGKVISILRISREVRARLGEPAAVAVDTLGRIYLAGRKTGQVVRYR